MISPEDKIALYNSKIRRVVPLKEVVQHLHLDGVGEQGPQGLQGIQGPKGDTGDKGDRGEDGSVGLQGIQGVQGTQGVKGDTGDGFSLAETYTSIAEMNADFSNAAIPVNSFVLINSEDADNGKLFVKGDTEYSFQAQLSGVKGDKGDTGEQGIQGSSGEQGPRGLQGISGLQGPQGERGLQGPMGVVGPQGVSGVQGLKGDKGNDGAVGERGPQGAQGVQGTQGVKGDKGDLGLQGLQGIQGITGAEGPKGDTGNGFSLAKIYPSIAEMNADFPNSEIPLHSFVLINSNDLDNGKLFVKDETAYSFQSQLSGVKGDKGDRGLQGAQGVAGVQGIRGIAGEQGLQGAQGERGLQGIQGAVGQQGIRGEKGDTGETGARGLQGLQGIQGSNGAQGLKGDKGDAGEGVVLTTGTVAVTTALTSRGGRLTSSNLQKQGIFTKLELAFYNGNTTTQAAGTRFTVAVLPTGFRPSQTVHTFASDNGSSNYPRHAILIETNGNVIWIPQNATGYFTMNFQVVF